AEQIITEWEATKQDIGTSLRRVLISSTYGLLGSVLNAALTHPDASHAAVGAGIGVGVKLLEGGVNLIRDRRKPRPYQYLTEIVKAESDTLRLTFPLGLERSGLT